MTHLAIALARAVVEAGHSAVALVKSTGWDGVTPPESLRPGHNLARIDFSIGTRWTGGPSTWWNPTRESNYVVSEHVTA